MKINKEDSFRRVHSQLPRTRPFSPFMRFRLQAPPGSLQEPISFHSSAAACILPESYIGTTLPALGDGKVRPSLLLDFHDIRRKTVNTQLLPSSSLYFQELPLVRLANPQQKTEPRTRVYAVVVVRAGRATVLLSGIVYTQPPPPPLPR